MLVEDRAVADVVPVDHPGDAGPRRVARHQVDLREDGTPVGLGELEALQGGKDVLVGHGCVRRTSGRDNRRCAGRRVVEVVERRPLRPGAVVRRHVADRSPPGPFERVAECQAVALDELVVAQLIVDPGARLHGGMRKPAEPAERRRGEETAARGETGGLQSLGVPVESRDDPWRERRSPGSRPCRSSRRTRAAHPCRAGRSATGRLGCGGSGRGGSGRRRPRGPPRLPAPRGPRGRPGRRRSRRRSARTRRGSRRTPSRAPRRRRAPSRPAAPPGGGPPRPWSGEAPPAS